MLTGGELCLSVRVRACVRECVCVFLLDKNRFKLCEYRPIMYECEEFLYGQAILVMATFVVSMICALLKLNCGFATIFCFPTSAGLKGKVFILY